MMMRRIGRVLTVLVLLAVGVSGAAWAGAGQACACSCMPRSPAETVERAGAVVVGTAIAEREAGMRRVYLFTVEESYKTRVHQRIEIWTASQGPSCGLQLTIGDRHTVVLYKQIEAGGDYPVGAWSTNSCVNLSSLSPVPASAGAPLEPIAGGAVNDDAGRALTRSPWVVAGWALAGVVVVVGGALAVRRRRRTDS